MIGRKVVVLYGPAAEFNGLAVVFPATPPKIFLGGFRPAMNMKFVVNGSPMEVGGSASMNQMVIPINPTYDSVFCCLFYRP